jgi:hypothetical protein
MASNGERPFDKTLIVKKLDWIVKVILVADNELFSPNFPSNFFIQVSQSMLRQTKI